MSHPLLQANETQENDAEALSKVLFGIFEEVRFRRHGKAAVWEHLDERHQQAWLAVANFVGAVNEWKAKTRKYGRHLPSCPVGAPCECGFEEVERQVA